MKAKIKTITTFIYNVDYDFMKDYIDKKDLPTLQVGFTPLETVTKVLIPLRNSKYDLVKYSEEVEVKGSQGEKEAYLQTHFDMVEIIWEGSF